MTRWLRNIYFQGVSRIFSDFHVISSNLTLSSQTPSPLPFQTLSTLLSSSYQTFTTPIKLLSHPFPHSPFKLLSNSFPTPSQLSYQALISLLPHSPIKLLSVSFPTLPSSSYPAPSPLSYPATFPLSHQALSTLLPRSPIKLSSGSFPTLISSTFPTLLSPFTSIPSLSIA